LPENVGVLDWSIRFGGWPPQGVMAAVVATIGISLTGLNVTMSPTVNLRLTGVFSPGIRGRSMRSGHECRRRTGTRLSAEPDGITATVAASPGLLVVGAEQALRRIPAPFPIRNHAADEFRAIVVER
jgi:hypothetical protein